MQFFLGGRDEGCCAEGGPEPAEPSVALAHGEVLGTPAGLQAAQSNAGGLLHGQK